MNIKAPISGADERSFSQPYIASPDASVTDEKHREDGLPYTDRPAIANGAAT